MWGRSMWNLRTFKLHHFGIPASTSLWRYTDDLPVDGTITRMVNIGEEQKDQQSFSTKLGPKSIDLSFWIKLGLDSNSSRNTFKRLHIREISCECGNAQISHIREIAYDREKAYVWLRLTWEDINVLASNLTTQSQFGCSCKNFRRWYKKEMTIREY